jgi:hypothetical protein
MTWCDVGRSSRYSDRDRSNAATFRYVGARNGGWGSREDATQLRLATWRARNAGVGFTLLLWGSEGRS